MDEFRARRVVDQLRDRGVNAHLLRANIGQYGERVSLPGGREAEWDTDGTAGLEAQVMRDGMLVGYVPQIEGSGGFDEAQPVDASPGPTTTSPSPVSGPPCRRLLRSPAKVAS